MSFTDIKTKNQGFTIVELLIVVVVIAILAAITIVSYNGITNNAKKSSAESASATFAKKAEAYLNDTAGGNGKYPDAATDIVGASSGAVFSMPTGSISVTYSGAALSAAPTDPATINVAKCASGAATNQSNITESSTATNALVGLKISYWNYATGAAGTMNVGTTTNCPAAA